MKEKNNIEDIKEEYFYTNCNCHDFNHTIRYYYFIDDDYDPELCAEMVVNNYDSIFKRIRMAFNYIFKRERFSCTITSLIDKNNAIRLRDFLSAFIIDYDKWLMKKSNEQ